ncbi:MAG: glycosyltransferase family 2 protein [Deferrisomatales bacterium]|nr:glycosyltransferase family 2 protein [Deferrisomatales bacterium]
MVGREPGSRPFVTIGVTTYNRHELLRQALHSILAQSFGDFEVIVGNDYTEEVLGGEMFGITDPRIRFINHPRNLREVGNMNALLEMATGRYFTWLFDDDLYQPNFLRTAHDCLAANAFPPAFFPSYRDLLVTDVYQPRQVPPRPPLVLSGRQFLDGYFAGRLKLVSTCGLFETAALRETVGGVEELCDSAIGVYCEYLFLLRCALLDRIVYMGSPFVVMRAHAGSWSESNSELEKYVEAGKGLVRKGGEVLRHPALSADFSANLMGVCRLHLITFAYRSARLEVARRRFGAGAVLRAMARHWKETAATRRSFLGQGGGGGWRIRLGFVRLQAVSCAIIVFQILYYFYYSHIGMKLRPRQPGQ